MASPVPTHFELHGEFCGFIRTLLGKKRMVLRVGGEDHFLKVEKELRHRLKATLAPGSEILVSGAEVDDHGRPILKRVVSDVRLMTANGPVACVRYPVRVCTKKTCWRNGGQELWHALEGTLARRGFTATVELEGVHCLDHCKRGPNAEWQGHDYHHCTPRDAERIVDAAAGKLAKVEGR
ncbi:MAG: (2Fe-2S) ferredoxin domain-containing protein [Chthoniobacter sp.]|uniref:(2Fe-2S) ferredoxin domain-containing protein n=1 Tax=Chthoniobacter sp. TaxID=2510640 RepID=UPI0032AE1A93